jgi:hypothetical protein
MPPHPGSVHTRARTDSGAARMWDWAQTQRTPWTTIDLCEAIDGSARRTRAIVAAWLAAGLVRRVVPTKRQSSYGANRVGYARRIVSYEIAGAHRGSPAPVMIVRDGVIVGARISPSP